MRLVAEALTEKQLQAIHQATLDLLAGCGIAIHHVPSLQLFKRHGAEVAGEIVKLPEQLITNALTAIPPFFKVIGRNPHRTVGIGEVSQPVLGPAAGAVYIIEHDNRRRPAALSDLQNFLRLSQASEVINVSCAGIIEPADLPPQGKHLYSMLEAIKQSDKPLLGLSLGKRVAADSIALAQIATEGAGEHYVIGIVNTLSPMAWDERMLEAVWEYAGKNQPLVITCCSMAGFTSPTTLPSTIVQNNAEVLAGIVLAQLINPGTPVVYGNTSTITDMLSMNLCIGAPEYAMLSTAFAQLASYYRIPFRSGGGLTDAKDVDAQAGIEAAMNLLFTLANKVDFVLHTVGIMESFLSISYEKWIVDEEICQRIFRMQRGLGDLPDEAVPLIGEVGPAGHYLDKPDTLMNFKEQFYRPLISDRTNWDGWLHKQADAKQAARHIWQKRLREYVCPELPAEVNKALQKYIETAK